jgi:hypothetical protein
MRWFRSTSGRVAWLAYFALACQLVLTFGHVHLGNTRLVPSAIAITTDATGGSDAAPSLPARKAPAGLARDICAVCNNITLANALVLPVLLAFILPTSSLPELQWPPEAIEFAPHDHVYFHARGPPHA